MRLTISFPLRSPLVFSLVDYTLDALERLERIVDVGIGRGAESLWFYPACLQATEVSLSGLRFLFRYALVTPYLTLPLMLSPPPCVLHITSTRLALALHVWYHCYPPFSLTAHVIVVSARAYLVGILCICLGSRHAPSCTASTM
jgi:hypothetical protein